WRTRHRGRCRHGPGSAPAAPRQGRAKAATRRTCSSLLLLGFPGRLLLQQLLDGLAGLQFLAGQAGIPGIVAVGAEHGAAARLAEARKAARAQTRRTAGSAGSKRPHLLELLLLLVV